MLFVLHTREIITKKNIYFFMKKSIGRIQNSTENLEEDPLNSSIDRTITFNKTGMKNETDFRLETNEEDDNIETEKPSNETTTVQNISGPAGTAVQILQKIQSIRKNIEDEKKTKEEISDKIAQKSTSLESARKNLREKERELQGMFNEATSNFTVGDKFSMVGHASSKMLHDIRAPLTVLKGQVELIKLQHGNNEDNIMLESFERMEGAIKKITAQINDVLNFVREAPYEIKKYETTYLIDSSLQEINIPSEVDFEMPKQSCIVDCDETKTRSILMNIIQNAIDAMDNKGKIRFRVLEHGNYCLLQIEDSGPGVPIENMDKIFEPLFTTKFKGNGLGLSNCKEILLKQGGSIFVKNSPTTFTVCFKKSQ